MKTLWTALSVLAVANLLAIGGFVGWLKMSDRLDKERAVQVREMFAKTLTQVKSEAEEAKAKQEAEDKARAEQAKKERLPLTASEQLSTKIELSELDRQRVALLKSQVESLRDTLAREQADLGKQRAALDAEKKQFQSEVEAFNALGQDAQFKTALGVIESLKPAEAKSVLDQVIAGVSPQPAPAALPGPGFAPVDGGAPVLANAPAAVSAPAAQRPPGLSGKKLAAAYLNAMEERQRSKVMSEFLKADPKLAGELLEMLRTHGQVAQATPSSAR
jgi:molecular chaperone GrpE (heat shock protein)